VKRRRLLLAARALSCGTLLFACKSDVQPLGNSKPSFYDEGMGGAGGAQPTEPTEGTGGAVPDGGTTVPEQQP